MHGARKTMALTEELTRLCHRDMTDPGDDPHVLYFEDADYDRAAARLAAEVPREGLWIFAYGSLVWKPEFEPADRRRAVAPGWKRSFSIWLDRWRGSKEEPGLMMALAPGGACEGLALKVKADAHEAAIRKLLVRELGTAEELACARWIDLHSEDGIIRALTFYADTSPLACHAEGLSDLDIARVLARACGHLGSGADYLRRTVEMLEEHGVHDEGLWRLQDLTAEAIRRRFGL